MRAAVLGATGHIGAHVTRALLARGHQVRATYRNPRYAFLLDGLPVERLRLDLHDAGALRRAVDGCEAVFVCGGYYPGWRERRTGAIARGLAQVRGIFDVLQQARPGRVMFTSSASTIAPVPGRASTEADHRPWPPPRANLYSTVKTAMERAVLEYAGGGLPVLITHPSICIGEYDAHAFSGRLILMYAARRWRVPVTLDHEFNIVYTGDVGLGHVLAAERGRPGEHYLLVGEHMTMRDFAHRTAKIAGVKPPAWRLPYPRFPAQRLDGAKTQRELGLVLTPADEAIRRAVEWFRRRSRL